MSNFLTRVELHSITSAEIYDSLHKAMVKAGFSRIITGDDGVKYHLPTAEYLFSGDSRTTAPDVNTLAATTAQTVATKFATLTVSWYGASWVGLTPV